MRIIKSLKFAQEFDEVLDHIDDDTIKTLNQYESGKDKIKIDYDSLEEGQEPIGDDNFDEYLAENNLEDDEKKEIIPTEEFPMEEVPIEEAPTVVAPLKEVPTEEEAQEQETPPAEESVPDPEKDLKDYFGSDAVSALKWAKENKRVVQIFYNTEGRKKGRGGKQYLKRELNLPKLDGGGVGINRIIEPHYFFKAKKTNRWILVTYDRSVRHVRTYILNNITDYNFTKNRRTGDDQYFGNRTAIKTPSGNDVPNNNKPIRGIDKMENINDSLTEMGAALKVKGLVKSASVIKNADEVLKSLKTAQYVGVQGYWLRNRRCWDNCYRQKRTTQPETPAQEVWMQCWDEYREAINNPKSGWEKYAKRNENIKISAKEEDRLNKEFASKVSKKIKVGMSTPEAVYTIIEKEKDIQKDKMLESSAQLMELADTLSSGGMVSIGEKLAGISSNMLKEAGFGNLMKGVGKGISDMWRGKEKSDPEKESLQTVINKLQQIQLAAENVLRTINRGYSFADSKNIVIEAGKGTKIVEAQTKFDEARMKALEQQQKQKGIDDLAYDSNQREEEANKMDQAADERSQFGSKPAPPSAPSTDDGPNNVPDGQEDKDKNNVPDGQEDKNNNQVPDGEEDNNQNQVPDGEEDNTGAATETTEPKDENQDGKEDTTGQPIDQAKQQANQALFKNFRRVYNGVKQNMRELAPIVSQLGQNSPASQYLNAALNNFQSFVGEVDNHYNQQTLNNQTIAPLLQNLIKVTMDAQRGLSSGMEGVDGGAGVGDVGAGDAGVGGEGAGDAGVGGAGVGGAGAGGVGVGDAGVGDQTGSQGILTYNEQNDIKTLMSNPKAYGYVKNLIGKIENMSKQNIQSAPIAAAYNHKLKLVK